MESGIFAKEILSLWNKFTGVPMGTSPRHGVISGRKWSRTTSNTEIYMGRVNCLPTNGPRDPATCRSCSTNS